MGTETIKFFGGVHPTDGYDKALSAGKEIACFVPDVVKVSMKQGLGPACTLLVKEGDAVKQGDLIGEAGHFLSANVHAPVTGTVTKAEGDFCEIQVQECKLPDKNAQYNQTWCDASGYDRAQLVELLKQGGLVGMGGAGFPTHVKYATKDPITHVLINAAECEPFLTCDEHTMLEFGMALLNGVLLLKKAADAPNAVICMEENKAHCKEHLEKLLAGHEEDIQIKLLPTKYPQGGEKQLIAAVMGVEIPSGKLPANVGAIVSNVQTAKATADLVYGGLASMSRCITITGNVNNPGNYLVPLGTCIGELVALAGDVKETENKVILGGPMTGRCIGMNISAKDITDCISKTSGGLVVLEGKTPVESKCIRCGRCAKACPIGLNPSRIDAAIRKDEIGVCQKLQATECIACGCCSYSCPAGRELTHFVVTARDAVRAKMREEASRG